MRRLAHAACIAAIAFLAGCAAQQAGPPPPPPSRYEVLSQSLRGEVASGQVQISEMEGRLRITLLNDLLFSDGQWDLTDAGQQALDKVLPQLREASVGRIEVDGYTDNVPIGAALRRNFANNRQLSSARAEAVARYLKAGGVDRIPLVTTGFGDADPVAPNTTPQGRTRNRRVEITLITP